MGSKQILRTFHDGPRQSVASILVWLVTMLFSTQQCGNAVHAAVLCGVVQRGCTVLIQKRIIRAIFYQQLHQSCTSHGSGPMQRCAIGLIPGVRVYTRCPKNALATRRCKYPHLIATDSTFDVPSATHICNRVRPSLSVALTTSLSAARSSCDVRTEGRGGV